MSCKSKDMSTLITVTGLQKNFSNEDIELYFETPKSGGSNGCVKKCIIDQDGVAIIEFKSPEVAANVVSKGHHKLFDCSLAVQYAPADDIAKRSKLLVTQLPSEIEMDYLKALLEKTLGTTEFSLEVSANSAATIIFHNIYTDAEFQSLIAKVESKQVRGVNLKAQQIKEILIHTPGIINTGALTTVKVTGLPTNVNDEEVELYFETQKSGGRKGSIRKCVIEQNGVAFLEFDDPEVAANVVSKGEHTLYGCLLAVQYVTPEQIAKKSELLLTQLPSELDVDYLQLLLEKALGTGDFSLQKHDDNSAMISFHRTIPCNELQLIITKLESTKGRCRNLKVLTEDIFSSSIKITGVPPNISIEDIKHYFEDTTWNSGFRKGSVRNCTLDKNGVAIIEFDRPEVAAAAVSKEKHIICRTPLIAQYVYLKKQFSCSDENPLCLIEKARTNQEKVSSLTKSASSTDSSEVMTVETAAASRSTCQDQCLNKILLTNLPCSIDTDHLKLQLEKATKLHCSEEFLLDRRDDTSATITFKRSLLLEELQCFVEKTNKIVIKNKNLKAEICNNESRTDQPECTPRLLILELPEDADEDHLQLIVEKLTNMSTASKEITLDRKGSKSALIIDKSLSDKELQIVITNLQNGQVKGKSIAATELKSSNAIAVSNITEQYYDVQFLENYFENQRGGAVEEVKLCGSGQAMVIFQDQNAVSCVLKTSHDKYGMKVTNLSPHEAFGLWCAATSSVELSKTLGFMSDAPVNEKCISLAPENFAFLSQAKYSNISKAFPLLSVCFAYPNIVVNGPSSMIQQFEKQLPIFSMHHRSVATELRSFFPFLKTKVGTKLLQDYICSHNCSAVAYAAECDIYLLCEDDASSIKSAKVVTAAVHCELLCKKVPILKSRESEFQKLCQKVTEDQKVHITHDYREVTLTGFKGDVENAADIFCSLVRKYAESPMSMVTVTLENGVWKLLQKSKWWKSEVVDQKALMSVAPQDLMVTAVTISGQNDMVQCLNTKIGAFKSSIMKKSIPLSKPAHQKCFESSFIKDMVFRIESQHNVSIEMQLVSNTGLKSANTPLNQEVKPVNDSCNKVSVVHTREQKKIAIWIGDITKFKADVMVNAANEDLKHIGGVALAIANNGGPIIQESSDAYIKELKRALKEGEVFFSTAVGNLPCKALIHAVGPRWYGGRNNEDKLLFSACFNSLTKAIQYTSIVLPVISGGIFGYPFSECANILLKAVMEFSSKNPSSHLQEINFVLISQPHAKMFNDVVQKYLSNGTLVPDVSENSFLQHATLTTHPTSISDCLQLRKGSIVDIQADVYVNSTSPDLDLTSGQVSIALSKAAGPLLAQECARKATIRKAAGDITVTGGGNLKCKHVFHVVLKHYDEFGKEANEIFKTSVRGCLEECAKRNLSSIAFPAIGIGTHSFPISVAAKSMINEATQFLAQKQCSLTAIYLAAYSDIEFATFQSELRHLKLASSQASTVSDFSMWGKGRKDKNVFHIGGQIVEVIRGDITDEQTDVIVSITDRDIKLQGTGVAAAISKKAGPELQRFCDHYSHGVFLEAGSVISTPACGELKCKAIFQTNFQWGCLEKSVLNCLNKAAQEGYVSISFPALGTGNYNFPSDKTASVMIESINTFSNTSLHLELIHIVLYQEDMYKSFLKTFQSSERCTQSIAATKATDPIHHEQAQAIGSEEATSFDMDTCYFIVYGESSNVESAALELNKMTSAPSLSSSEYHLKVSETQQGLCQMFTLVPSSEEYKSVLVHFPQHGNYEVIEVQHIVNQSLYGRYVSLQEEFYRSSPRRGTETLLFFGTDTQTYPKINAQGFHTDFQRSFAYGKGLQFFTSATRAITLSSRDASGFYYVYRACVLTGEFTYGNSSMVGPPSKHSHPSVLYDSVVDNVSNPSVYVIFNSSQAYPRYLIKLKYSSII